MPSEGDIDDDKLVVVVNNRFGEHNALCTEDPFETKSPEAAAAAENLGLLVAWRGEDVHAAVGVTVDKSPKIADDNGI